jgi:hypothetical protein
MSCRAVVSNEALLVEPLAGFVLVEAAARRT